MNYLRVIFKNLNFFYINYNFAHFKQIKNIQISTRKLFKTIILLKMFVALRKVYEKENRLLKKIYIYI